MEDSARLADLLLKLKARENKPGFAANVKSLKEEIARLEEKLKALDEGGDDTN